MEFGKYLADYAIVFFIIALIEAAVILGLVVYLFFRKRDSHDDNKDVEYTSEILNKKNKEVEYWRNAFLDCDRERKALKNEKGTIVNKRGDLINQDSQRDKAISNSECEQAHNSYNSHEEYARDQQRKGIYLQETTNDDGTKCQNLYFDLSNKRELDSSDEMSSDSFEESVPVVTFTPKYEYLETANGGQFRKLFPSDEKSLFRTWVENGVRKFEFYGNVDNALANFNAVFDDVCEIEGKQNGATQITNVEPGILSSQLKVEKKAKIKLN